MVASSVVTTIMILNYHHRQADTHEMPSWVNGINMLLSTQSQGQMEISIHQVVMPKENQQWFVYTFQHKTL